MHSLWTTAPTARNAIAMRQMKYACECPPGLLGCLTLRSEPGAVGVARRFATLVLTTGGFGHRTDTFELLVSELVTNAVIHPQCPATAPIGVRLFTTGPAIRLEVHDSDPRVPLPRLLKPDDETGRGLAIVKALASQQGFFRTSTGKCVWCEVHG
jgi:anti-sigma regulatory factor (Ser/Thr protein kinase)